MSVTGIVANVKIALRWCVEYYGLLSPKFTCMYDNCLVQHVTTQVYLLNKNNPRHPQSGLFSWGQPCFWWKNELVVLNCTCIGLCHPQVWQSYPMPPPQGIRRLVAYSVLHQTILQQLSQDMGKGIFMMRVPVPFFLTFISTKFQ